MAKKTTRVVEVEVEVVGTFYACTASDYCVPPGGEDTPEGRILAGCGGRSLRTSDPQVAEDRRREKEVLVLVVE